MQMNDTHPEIEKKYREMLMSLSREERMKMAFSMFDAAKKIIYASLPENMDEIEKKVQLFLRIYGNDFDDVQKQKIITRIREYWQTNNNS